MTRTTKTRTEGLRRRRTVRNARVVVLRERDLTYGEIGRLEGITRQRVSQILSLVGREDIKGYRLLRRR